MNRDAICADPLDQEKVVDFVCQIDHKTSTSRAPSLRPSELRYYAPMILRDPPTQRTETPCTVPSEEKILRARAMKEWIPWRVDYLSFFLGRSWDECPHFLFLCGCSRFVQMSLESWLTTVYS